MLKWPHLGHGLAFEAKRLCRLGPAKFGARLLRKLLGNLIWLALLPIALVGHAAGYRRITVFTDRIGHLALEPDCLLKAEALGDVPRRRWFMLAPPRRTANTHLLRYWHSRITVHTHPLSCFLIGCLSLRWLMRYDISHYVLAAAKAQEAYRIHSRWQGRPALLQLFADDEAWGAARMLELGIPDKAWFVCIHAREGGFSPVDEVLQAHRNSDILATVPAIQAITARGGWVIRVGDPSMRALPSMPGLIDYAHHPLKSDRLDIILCAKARFMLGNTSGIALVSTIFGIPCAIANTIPLPTLWFGERDLCIPKLCWSNAEARYLRFDEIFECDIAAYRYAAIYAENGLRVDDNSPEEIAELACEMMDRLDGAHAEDDSDRARQAFFKALFTPRHYAHGSCAQIGSRFLRRHAELLGESEGNGTRATQRPAIGENLPV
jgi:putative glycosyltransferase (TIGR04372 family)